MRSFIIIILAVVLCIGYPASTTAEESQDGGKSQSRERYKHEDAINVRHCINVAGNLDADILLDEISWYIYKKYSDKTRIKYETAYERLTSFWEDVKEKFNADKNQENTVNISSQEESNFRNFKIKFEEFSSKFESSLKYHNPKYQPRYRPFEIKGLEEYEDQLKHFANELGIHIQSKTFMEMFKNLQTGFVGDTKIYGFHSFQTSSKPVSFGLFLYSLDTMLPVIDLHAYSSYYPLAPRIRLYAAMQHILGWWFLTAFLASLAIQ